VRVPFWRLNQVCNISLQKATACVNDDRDTQRERERAQHPAETFIM